MSILNITTEVKPNINRLIGNLSEVVKSIIQKRMKVVELNINGLNLLKAYRIGNVTSSDGSYTIELHRVNNKNMEQLVLQISSHFNWCTILTHHIEDLQEKVIERINSKINNQQEIIYRLYSVIKNELLTNHQC